MKRKQLWVLVGGNGAGKSTFYRTRLQTLGLPFVNADILAMEFFPEAPEKHSYDAAAIAERLRYDLLKKGRSFCFETVFSHPSKVDFIASARALGYEVTLVYIHLQFAELNIARVAQRVSEKGHDVPIEKIKKRIPLLVENVRRALPLCNRIDLLDNSTANFPFAHIATLKGGELTVHQKPLPGWASGILNVNVNPNTSYS